MSSYIGLYNETTFDGVSINVENATITNLTTTNLTATDGAFTNTLTAPKITLSNANNQIIANNTTINVDNASVKTLTVPDSSGVNAEFVLTETDQTINGIKEFTDEIVLKQGTYDDPSIQFNSFLTAGIYWNLGICLSLGSSLNYFFGGSRTIFYNYSNSSPLDLDLRRSRGTYAAQTELLSGDDVAEIEFMPCTVAGATTSASYTPNAKILVTCLENQSLTNLGSSMRFYTTAIGSSALTERLSISGNDNITSSLLFITPTLRVNTLTTGIGKLDSSGNLSSSLIVDADVDSSAAIALSKLASGTSGKLIVCNGSNVPTYVYMSGDATLLNTGEIVISGSSDTDFECDTLTVNSLASIPVLGDDILTNNVEPNGLDVYDLGSALNRWNNLYSNNSYLYNIYVGGSLNFTTYFTNGVLYSDASGLIFCALLTNNNVDPGAGIEYSKLDLSNGILNNDINASAAIAYSKLNLTGSIVNADLSSSSTIVTSITNPSTDNTLVRFNSTGGKSIQGSSIVCDDSDNLSGIGSLSSGAITTTGEFNLIGGRDHYVYYNSADANGPRYRLAKSRGSYASPTYVLNGDNLGSLNFMSYDGSTYSNSATIQVLATEDHTLTRGSKFQFYTNANGGSPGVRMELNSDALTCYGDIKPDTDNANDIGSDSVSFKDTYSYRFLGEDGSTGAPSFSFQSETNSGIYRKGTGQLGFVAIGTESFYFGNAQIASIVPLRLADGSVSSPSLSFTSSTNTGIYYASSELITAISGTNITSVNQFGLVVEGTNRIFNAPNGNVPQYTFDTLLGYGLGYSSSSIGLYANSTEGINITSSLTTVQNNLLNEAGYLRVTDASSMSGRHDSSSKGIQLQATDTTDDANVLKISCVNDTTTTTGNLNFYKARVSTTVTTSDVLGSMNWYGYSSGAWRLSASLDVVLPSVWSAGSSYPSEFIFKTCDSGSATPDAILTLGENVEVNKGDLLVTNNIQCSQISFDSGSNYLDYYETGSWTPSIQDGSGNTATHTSQSGRYTRIGDVVNFRCQVSWSSLSGLTGANNLRIRGLPFNCASTQDCIFSILSTNGAFSSFGYKQIIASNYSTVQTDAIIFSGTDISGTHTVLTVSTFNSSGLLYITGTYFV